MFSDNNIIIEYARGALRKNISRKYNFTTPTYDSLTVAVVTKCLCQKCYNVMFFLVLLKVIG